VHIDTSADVWSMGVLIYELMTMSLPFKGKDIRTLRRHLFLERTHMDHLKDIDRSYSRNLNRLVVAMLSLIPSTRPTIL
jgi:serine/threonine protein kinase